MTLELFQVADALSEGTGTSSPDRTVPTSPMRLVPASETQLGSPSPGLQSLAMQAGRHMRGRARGVRGRAGLGGGGAVLTSLASGSAASWLGAGGPALLPGPPAPAPASTRGGSSSCNRFSCSGELHLELKSGESGRCGGLGGSGGRDGAGEWEAGVGGPSAGAWATP